MSDEEPYDEEFDSEEEPDYFKEIGESARDKEREKLPAASKPDPANEDEDYNEYDDDDFEDKSAEVSAEPPKATMKPETQAVKAKHQAEDEDYDSNEEDFFMTGIRPKSKETLPDRRVSGGELRSNVQSSGKLTSVSHFDSPEKAMKYLGLLKKENISLRGDLKQINDRLNEILDQRIAESKPHSEPRKMMQPEQREKATNAQLDSAMKQLQMIKKEKVRVYKRLQQVQDGEYVEELKSAVEKKEKLLKKLQKSQKSSKKTQQTREKDIEKEIVRTEQSLNTRVLQELQMENDGMKMKIRELEKEDERNASVAAEMESQQEKLEQRYVKLMTLAKQNGTFDDSTRENKRLHKLKAHYEEQKSALLVLQGQSETALKQLRRLEHELKAELEALKQNQRSAADQMREKQSKMTQLLEELQFLRPKVVGSGYESLLDRISTSIKEKEALVDKPITPLRLRSLEAEKEPILRGKSAVKTSLEGRKSPVMEHAEGKAGRAGGKSEEGVKPPASTSKPTLFSSVKEEEKPPSLPPKPSFEEAKEPEISKKPQLFSSKPSLFSSAKVEPTKEFGAVQGKDLLERAEDVIPTRETKPSELVYSAKPAPPSSGPSLFDSKPSKAPDLTFPPDQPKPTLPNPPPDEIGTLDTFPSRRRGKKAAAEPLPTPTPSVLPPKDLFPETDSALKPRNRSHLLSEEPQTTIESAGIIPPKPPPAEPVFSLFESPQSSAVPAKQGRDRSHLLEDPGQNTNFSATKPPDSDEFRLGKRDRSHLQEEKPALRADLPKPTGLLERKRDSFEEKKGGKTSELAKKAEKGGFFSEIDEESLDFSDLGKAIAPIQPLPMLSKPTPQAREPTPPASKKPEPLKSGPPQPQILDLEESDIML